MQFSPEAKKHVDALERAQIISQNRNLALHSNIEDLVAMPLTLVSSAALVGLMLSGVAVPTFAIWIAALGPYGGAQVYKIIKGLLRDSAENRFSQLLQK